EASRAPCHVHAAIGGDGDPLRSVPVRSAPRTLLQEHVCGQRDLQQEQSGAQHDRLAHNSPCVQGGNRLGSAVAASNPGASAPIADITAERRSGESPYTSRSDRLRESKSSTADRPTSSFGLIPHSSYLDHA